VAVDDRIRERGKSGASVQEPERPQELDDVVRRCLRERSWIGVPAQEALIQGEDKIGARSLKE
jgi:hypothetical protein